MPTPTAKQVCSSTKSCFHVCPAWSRLSAPAFLVHIALLCGISSMGPFSEACSWMCWLSCFLNQVACFCFFPCLCSCSCNSSRGQSSR